MLDYLNKERGAGGWTWADNQRNQCSLTEDSGRSSQSGRKKQSCSNIGLAYMNNSFVLLHSKLLRIAIPWTPLITTIVPLPLSPVRCQQVQRKQVIDFYKKVKEEGNNFMTKQDFSDQQKGKRHREQWSRNNSIWP
jgi:hypothetical protein